MNKALAIGGGLVAAFVLGTVLTRFTGARPETLPSPDAPGTVTGNDTAHDTGHDTAGTDLQEETR